MKRILLHIFIVLLVTSCSTDDNDPIENGSSKVEVKLYADMGVITKAPIESAFTSDFSIGIYAKEGQWKNGSTANWINNDPATVAGSAGHTITFSYGPYFYPFNGNVLDFYAFAPFANETTTATTGISPKVTHLITGKEDVMWAKATGQKSTSDPVSMPVFNFAHKLTQLQFTFKADSGYPLTNKVISLKVKAQPTHIVMNVETGACSFTGSSDMEALSPANQTAGISITTGGQNAFSPIMTKAATGPTAYTLDIVVRTLSGDITYTGIPINVNAVEGNSHMITLTFKVASDLPIGISPIAQS